MTSSAKIERPAAKADDKTAKADDSKDAGGENSSEATVDPTIIGTPDDYQLARAVDMLRGIAMFNGRVVN